MAILTVAELQQAFDVERVTQLASDYDEVRAEPIYDETILEAAIAQAEDLIKAALSKQYTTVQLEADKFVERMVADVTMYYLEFRRNQFTPSVERAFERVKEYLRKLEEGSYKLSGVTQLLPEGNTTQPTEVLELGSEFFKNTEEEADLLAQS